MPTLMPEDGSQRRGLMRLQADAKRRFHSKAACWTDAALCPTWMSKDCSLRGPHISHNKDLPARQPAGLRALRNLARCQRTTVGRDLDETAISKTSQQRSSRLQACTRAFLKNSRRFLECTAHACRYSSMTHTYVFKRVKCPAVHNRAAWKQCVACHSSCRRSHETPDTLAALQTRSPDHPGLWAWVHPIRMLW